MDDPVGTVVLKRNEWLTSSSFHRCSEQVCGTRLWPPAFCAVSLDVPVVTFRAALVPMSSRAALGEKPSGTLHPFRK